MAQAALVQADVRSLAGAVARDVTRYGPAAWRKHFAESPSFFMVAEGRMEYPNSEAATVGLRNLTQAIKSIELTWEDDLRVDPLTPELAVLAASWHEVLVDTSGKRVNESGLFTAVAQRRDGRWVFRDVHWSWPEHAPGVH